MPSSEDSVSDVSGSEEIEMFSLHNQKAATAFEEEDECEEGTFNLAPVVVDMGVPARIPEAGKRASEAIGGGDMITALETLVDDVALLEKLASPDLFQAAAQQLRLRMSELQTSLDEVEEKTKTRGEALSSMLEDLRSLPESWELKDRQKTEIDWDLSSMSIAVEGCDYLTEGTVTVTLDLRNPLNTIVESLDEAPLIDECTLSVISPGSRAIPVPLSHCGWRQAKGAFKPTQCGPFDVVLRLKDKTVETSFFVKDRFDPSRHGESIALLSNLRVARKESSSKRSECAMLNRFIRMGKDQAFTFRIRNTKKGRIRVGICNPVAPVNEPASKTSDGFALSCGPQLLAYHHEEKFSILAKKDEDGKDLPVINLAALTGDEVTVIADMEMNTVSFAVNDVIFSNTWTKIPSVVVPYVELLDVGDEVELL
ncbi:hypothetical protein KIPB_007580 [Kipferlia bialata]|uniref:B30.2/SPRY domain-containing protein n=1 Tax=Kipferlia bialata TaxID=797122 RepID=A0A9K3GKN5_9EUKA|nr:hypothetical protein KIPB_007580 [Kipferlia bialata]|eukprot:g7580.t1